MSWIDDVAGTIVDIFVGPTAGDHVGPEELHCSEMFAGLYCSQALEQLPTEAAASFRLLLDGVPLRAVEFFADGNGDYASMASIEGGLLELYIPCDGLVYVTPPGCGVDAVLEVVVVGRSTPKEEWEVVWQGNYLVRLPPAKRWRPVRFFAPLIQLGLAVAHADGHLSREEVRALKSTVVDQLEIDDPDSLVELKALLKGGAPADLAECLSELNLKVPGLTPSQVLEFMALVAHADGDIHPKEVDIIRRTAAVMGIVDELWDLISDENELNIIDYYGMLGVTPTTSKKGVKKAYRTLASQYHPDKVASLPVEFRDLAHRKTIELREAYEVLLKRAV